MVFLPIVLLLFYGPWRPSLTAKFVILIAASFVFYGFHTPAYVLLLAALILAN